MTTTVGIIGAGTAGLHIALRLLQSGVSFTLYAERDPDQVRAGRMQNTVVHFAPTLERERQLGVAHWDQPMIDSLGVNVHDEGGAWVGFTGKIVGQGQAIDYRLYQSQLLEDVIHRGGHVEYLSVSPEMLPAIAEKHEITVVATGKASLTQMFPRVQEHSPYRRPQRLLACFLAEGVDMGDRVIFEQNITPHTEVIEVPMWTAEGRGTGLLFEARPGSPFEALLGVDVESGTEEFEKVFVQLMETYVGRLRERIDPGAFKVRSTNDMLRGAVTPTVRKAYTVLPSGKLVVAAGDVQVVNDPLTGQGANTTSYAAFVLADMITNALAFDVAFGEKLDQKLWSYAQNVVATTNTLVGTPTPDWVGTIVAAALEDQSVADAWVSIVNNPEIAAEALGSAERARNFVARHRTPVPA